MKVAFNEIWIHILSSMAASLIMNNALPIELQRKSHKNKMKEHVKRQWPYTLYNKDSEPEEPTLIFHYGFFFLSENEVVSDTPKFSFSFKAPPIGFLIVVFFELTDSSHNLIKISFMSIHIQDERVKLGQYFFQ